MSVLKKVLFVGCILVVLKELMICVIDKVFHMTLPLAILFALCIWYGFEYRQEGDEKHNYISISCAILWGCIAVAYVGVAPKYFVSRELVSGGIGFVLVEVFERDIAFISNGRDGARAKADDIYLTKKGVGKDALLEYYREMVSSDVECQQKGNSLFFYIPGKENEEVTGAFIENKEGYDIVVVQATRSFKHKDILGRHYYRKRLYALD